MRETASIDQQRRWQFNLRQTFATITFASLLLGGFLTLSEDALLCIWPFSLALQAALGTRTIYVRTDGNHRSLKLSLVAAIASWCTWAMYLDFYLGIGSGVIRAVASISQGSSFNFFMQLLFLAILVNPIATLVSIVSAYRSPDPTQDWCSWVSRALGVVSCSIATYAALWMTRVGAT